MNRFRNICFFLFLFNHLCGQINEDSIKHKLSEYYLTGRFQDGLKTCKILLEKPQLLSEPLHVFIKVKQGLFHKDADQFTEALASFESSKAMLDIQGDTLSETYLELIEHYSYALSAKTQWDLAEYWARKALKNTEQLLGAKHPLYALAIFLLGYVYH